jgi:hypothetical protein
MPLSRRAFLGFSLAALAGCANEADTGGANSTIYSNFDFPGLVKRDKQVCVFLTTLLNAGRKEEKATGPAQVIEAYQVTYLKQIITIYGERSFHLLATKFNEENTNLDSNLTLSAHEAARRLKAAFEALATINPGAAGNYALAFLDDDALAPPIKAAAQKQVDESLGSFVAPPSVEFKNRNCPFALSCT